MSGDNAGQMSSSAGRRDEDSHAVSFCLADKRDQIFRAAMSAEYMGLERHAE